MSVLPQELVDIIIVLVGDDRNTLCACSLVCRSWVHTARILQFRTLKVRTEIAPTKMLVEILKSPLQTISTAIRHVSLGVSPLSSKESRVVGFLAARAANSR